MARTPMVRASASGRRDSHSYMFSCKLLMRIRPVALCLHTLAFVRHLLIQVTRPSRRSPTQQCQMKDTTHLSRMVPPDPPRQPSHNRHQQRLHRRLEEQERHGRIELVQRALTDERDGDGGSGMEEDRTGDLEPLKGDADGRHFVDAPLLCRREIRLAGGDGGVR